MLSGLCLNSENVHKKKTKASLRTTIGKTSCYVDQDIFEGERYSLADPGSQPPVIFAIP